MRDAPLQLDRPCETIAERLKDPLDGLLTAGWEEATGRGAAAATETEIAVINPRRESFFAFIEVWVR